MVRQEDDVHPPHQSASSSTQLSCPVVPGSSVDQRIRHKCSKHINISLRADTLCRKLR